MKKQFFFCSILLLIGLVARAQKSAPVTLLGTVSDVREGKVFLRNLTVPLPDTLLIKNGSFTYKGSLKETMPYILSDEQNRYQLFFMDPGQTVKLTLKRNDMQITFLEGAPSHEIFRSLIVAQDPLQQLAQQVQKGHNALSPNTDSLNAVMNAINNQLKINFYQFLEKNGESEVAAFVVYSAITNDRSVKVNTADTMFSFIRGKARTSFYGNELNRMVSKLRAIEVGYMAPDFTLPDTGGVKKITLSKLQGQYVLIDFWASWCGPCKAEIPFLKRAYQAYHNKGFEILSVSLDDKRDKWLDAVRQYQMPWLHASDVRGFNSVVNELYHVPAIPKTLLLDKSGKIIATDLRGVYLEQKLAELLGQP
jgi:thiol-disulfide isomerase/thioredoxin